MGKKYTRYRHIPFREPVDETIYKQIARAPDPDRLAAELGIVDDKKLKRLLKFLLSIVFLMNYYLVLILVTS